MASDTRGRIIEAAARLFAERGVTGTTVTAIEQESGLAAGKGSFYRHFSNKSALLEEVLDQLITHAAEAKESAQCLEESCDQLPSYLRADLRHLTGIRHLVAVLAASRDNARVRERIGEALVDGGIANESVALVSRISAASPASEDPAASAAVMISAMIGYALTTEFFGRPPGDIEADRFTDTLARILIGQHPPTPAA
ncbi:TetR/AcrR family transcriptional regulator [Gordonia sp. HY285]|uniref:TetR/AcrR family transcriptional regulator n=1 Tax=Gordonia liuliyuniae TaxID=2911517 RepID=A0ABS9IWU5_9ACTN|nr:TetR/AcrR family transcriptional regulator [Gordonia liuliyuniae]MCF8590043.1 TetR/AcrR family transcriptional regulator [Gordonia liuliyuniae]MCF8610333.1 TetR/AcrR family transcriptional regulator [Gordonia liuliyuniae]